MLMNPEDYEDYEDYKNPLDYKAVKVNSVELVRPLTNSRMAFMLPTPMTLVEVGRMLAVMMPGWKVNDLCDPETES
jgi:hypothetical protein